MRYLILRVPGHEYHQDLCYCLVPLCEPVCRFVATEAQRFLSYMLRDRFHVTSILWEGLPALYWYETLPAAIAALADTDKSRLLDARDEFDEELRVLDLPDDFAWPPSEAENDLLLLSNADFVRQPAPESPCLWVLWSAVLIRGNEGYDYHCAAVPLSVFQQSLASFPLSLPNP